MASLPDQTKWIRVNIGQFKFKDVPEGKQAVYPFFFKDRILDFTYLLRFQEPVPE